jgi:hypothetical protein
MFFIAFSASGRVFGAVFDRPIKDFSAIRPEKARCG